jgi:NAD(P)H dehydrogenase (quinone)
VHQPGEVRGRQPPYGTSHHAVPGAEPGSIDDNTRNAARHQAERVVTIARALKQGNAF